MKASEPSVKLGMIFVLPATHGLLDRRELLSPLNLALKHVDDEVITMSRTGDLVDAVSDFLGDGNHCSGRPHHEPLLKTPTAKSVLAFGTKPQEVFCMAKFRLHFALWILCLSHLPAQAQTETILQTFGYFPQGLSPCGTVIRDSVGDLYGTTLLGGATDNGVVFERGVGGKYKVLYSFQGAPDAGQPNAGVTEHAAGNLCGTTTFGGANNKGAIYKLTPGGVETVLYSDCALPAGCCGC